VKTRITPTEIAPETFLLHEHQGEGHAPVCVALNTMVIRGAEPVVVDTGMAEHRDRYLDDVFAIVEPEDIRWVFISHDDVDHTGNLNALLHAAPNATLVVNWFITERMGESLSVPPTRWRWVGDGDTLDVGDRALVAVRPPIFDSPTTRGLFDPSTGVYWASDAFATPMATPVRHVDELDRDAWLDGMTTFNHYVSPWLDLVDASRFEATVERVARLRPTTLVGCHTPVIDGDHVATAVDVARRAPFLVPAPQPDQGVLDALQVQLAAA
jgi:flavorubredoxin